MLPVEIKAIGGFALLYHSVRTSGYTQDIDTVTSDFCPEILNLIQMVADTLELPADWLNNYNVMDNDVAIVEVMLDAFWLPIDWQLSHINLWVADLETLLKSKLDAAELDHLSRRAQDFPDVVDILQALKCQTFLQAKAYLMDVGIDLSSQYPRTAQRLVRTYKARENLTPSRLFEPHASSVPSS